MSTWSTPPTPPDPTMGFGPQAPPPLPPGPFPPPQTPRSGPNPGLIVGLILLLVGVVAGGALLLTSGDDEDDTENASNRRGREDCAQELRRQDGSGVDVDASDGDISIPVNVDDEGGSGDGGQGGLPGAGGGAEAGVPAPCGAPEVPEAPDVPEMPDVEVPGPSSGGVDVNESGDVEIELPEVPEAPDVSDIPMPDSSGGSSGDVVTTLASSIYSNTPSSIDEGTAMCMAEVITGVVGEDAVMGAGGDYQILYGGTFPDEDAAIASGIYSNCTTSQQDADLAAHPEWPTPWVQA